MVDADRLSGYDQSQSSSALCGLDKRETVRSSPEAPCSSESEQSCLQHSHFRSVIVDNCQSESLEKHAPSAKSAKRKRAEDLLESTYGKVQRRGSAASNHLTHGRAPERVAWVDACGSEDCSSSSSGAGVANWCSFRLAVPPSDWPVIVGNLTSLPQNQLGLAAAASLRPSTSTAYRLPGNLSVHMVEAAAQLPEALQALRESMQDRLVAIDLEWQPDFGAGRSRVALMQLATSTCALLVRTCRMRYSLPPQLLDFLRDPSIVLLGYGWDGADEGKMQSTFRIGRADFCNYLDVQRVSVALGYQGYGLSSLTAKVLGFPLPKSRKVTMSNWEAKRLTQQQIIYAALDALITGQLFRAMRLWHSSPSPCTVCHGLIGSLVDCTSIRCTHVGCNRSFDTLGSLEQHARSAAHKHSRRVCQGCGRLTHAR